MISLKRTLTRALAPLVLLGLSSIHGAQAQTAADATVNFDAQITTITCSLKVSEGANPNSSSGNLNVDFGRISPTSFSSTAYTLQQAPFRTVTISASTSAGASATCGTAGNFNVLVDVPAANIQTNNSIGYVKNSLSGVGATNLALALFRGTGTGTPLSVTERKGLTGPLVGAASASLTSGSLQLTGALVTTTTGAPSAGAFNASVPLIIVYQ